MVTSVNTSSIIRILTAFILLFIANQWHLNSRYIKVIQSSNEDYHAARFASFVGQHHDTSSINYSTGKSKGEGASFSNEGLSACLLINDENPRLPEWMAFHWQILPLRSLIVAVDPNSRDDPTDILSRWSDEMGVEIDVWNDSHYLSEDMRGSCKSNESMGVDCSQRYRERQGTFLAKCLVNFLHRNKTWVLLTDVDEYIGSDALDMASGSSNNMSKTQHKTILDVLGSQGVLRPCLPFTRHLFGAKEDFNTSLWRDLAPLGFHDSDFVTLRYRWRAPKDMIKINRWQKNLVDVSRIPEEDIGLQLLNIHTPIPNWCSAPPKKYIPTLFRANHYLDSLEAYMYRGDARISRNYKTWEVKSKSASDELDTGLTSWLRMFVETVGRRKAKELLMGAGNFTK